ncbi:M20/M25/M40 family metallo-hydrolase [Chlorogloeopsis sp. ULAP02]|uniref:M20/M25/M40 family metallo-hydrolase n=1 Tax=Chlorogloeopsis sp. ULAP02 TaxID=3107926 RepID=UPI003134C9F5
MKKLRFLTFLLLLFFALLGIYQVQPPAAVPINAPLVEFSSGRAMKHLEAIAQKPHPIGSPEQAIVGDYIFNQLTAMGLSPEVQQTTVVNPRWGTPFIAGTVHNIIAKIPGTDNTKAILIAAHYDSVPSSPGASDDGAAVAAMLETIRALKVSLPLRNDVIFLFTDGEEPGLLGAKGFVDEHRWARDVGLVFNFEARGNSGASIMFETSSENGWLINEFAKAVKHPVANSLTHSIYKLLPNDTDLTMFKAAGLAGFNFAYLNGVVYYHSFADNLKNINERSLQHHGDYALALTRHFGNLDLQKPKASDAVYFDILGLALIHYPEAWVAPLTAFVSLLFIGVVVLGLRRRQLTFAGMSLGCFAFLGSMVITVIIVTLFWWIISNIYSEYRTIPQGDTYNSNFYAIAFVALSIAVISSLYVYFRKKVCVQNLTVGALLWWLILMVLTSIFLPGASYLFTLPLLFSLIGLGLIFVTKERDYTKEKRWLVLSVCAIPGIILLVPTIYLVFVALALSMFGVVTVMVVLLLGLLIPHLCLMSMPNKWLLPLTSILISLSFILFGSFTAGFSAQHPKPNSIFYGLNADTGQAIWASADEKPDEWTSQFLSQDIKQIKLAEYLPTLSRKFLTSQAPVVPLTPPNLELISDKIIGGVRNLQIHITSPRQARVLRVFVDSNTKVLAAAIDGKPIDNNFKDTHTELEKVWGLNYFALPQEGIKLTLEVKTSQPVKIRVVDQSDDLPEIPGKSFQQKPNYMMSTAFRLSDATLVSKYFTL